ASSADASSPIGNYPIVPTLQDPDSKLSNYEVTIHNGTLSVTKVPLTVNVGNASRLYGAANPEFSGTISGIRNSDDITASYSTTATPASSVGNYPITASLNDPGSKLGNYEVTINNGTLMINPAPLSVSAANKSRAYGAANPEFTGAIVGIQNGDNLTLSFSTSATATSPVGNYDIVPSINDPAGKLGNYTVSSANGTLSVTPALLIGTADDKSRAYGQTNPVFTVTYSGVVNNEDASIVTGELIGSTTAETNSPIGTYPISVSGQSAPNYTMQYVDGTLTVTPYALTVKADDKSKTYGRADPSLTA